MTPATDLTSGQHVTVTGSGFSANEALIATECADKGTNTTQGDCNLDGVAMTTSDAQGRVTINDFIVVKGPFGANHMVCGPQQRCLVGVAQPTPSPSEEADTPITFR